MAASNSMRGITGSCASACAAGTIIASHITAPIAALRLNMIRPFHAVALVVAMLWAMFWRLPAGRHGADDDIQQRDEEH